MNFLQFTKVHFCENEILQKIYREKNVSKKVIKVWTGVRIKTAFEMISFFNLSLYRAICYRYFQT